MHLLVTSVPTSEKGETLKFSEVPWLARKFAVAVLPSVSSLKILRNSPSKAPRKFLAFGNPLLIGRPDDPVEARLASLSNEWSSCDAVSNAVSSVAKTRMVRPFRSRAVAIDTQIILGQSPLPETAHEVCEIARLLNAATSDVHLGPKASETVLKKLNGMADWSGSGFCILQLMLQLRVKFPRPRNLD